MSEYIEIEAELDEDGRTIFFQTNLTLGPDQTVERYDSRDELAEGSPVAQALAGIEGIVAVEIAGNDLWVTCDSTVGWHAVAADVNAALKDFFI